jgi:NAD(P)-dependent dehydrogenase (short-subunit alcohol dehydrogenase family)
MCLGAFTATQKAIPLMLENPNGGTIIYTGATASLKGGAGFVNLAVPKFGLRALAQSVAREFAPQNVHVVHTVGQLYQIKSKTTSKLI